MCKWLLGVVVISFGIFGGLLVFMRFEGEPSFQISSVMTGALFFVGFLSVMSAGLHNLGIGNYLFGFVVPMLVGWGISMLGIEHPFWALGIGVALVGLLAWGAYEEYLSTPLSQHHISARHVPGLGVVVVRGRTPREVNAQLKKMRQKSRTV